MILAKKRRSTADPLIDEVRAIREALAEQYGNDVDKLCAEFRRVGSAYRRRLRSKSKRSLATHTTTSPAKKGRKK